MTPRSCTLTISGATASDLLAAPHQQTPGTFEMTCRPLPRHKRHRNFAAFTLAAVLFVSGGLCAIFSSKAFAEDDPALAQLAQLTVQKGFKNISLGDVCDRLHIGLNCKAYQLNASIDATENQKFGLPVGWHTSWNVLPQPHGGANVVITNHDDHIGYGYLIDADGGLKAATVGLSTSGDGKNWHWKPIAASDEVTQRFALEKAYWLAQIKAVQALPDRKN
jgi:hypothetical protein